jgi:hypothetical protein
VRRLDSGLAEFAVDAYGAAQQKIARTCGEDCRRKTGRISGRTAYSRPVAVGEWITRARARAAPQPAAGHRLLRFSPGERRPAPERVRRGRQLNKLQDTLGDLNDISVHEGLTERLADARQNGSKPKRGAANEALAARWVSGREETRIASVLKDAKRAYARFAKARPFWR